MEIVLGFLVFAALGIAFAAGWPHRLAQALRRMVPQIIWEGNASVAAVALTFDDGPDPEFTPQVLETLIKYNVKATFFLVGQQAEKYPDQVRAIRSLGHEIGNHSGSWRRTILLSPPAFEADLLSAENILEIRGKPKLFRPAGILLRPSHLGILRRHNYVCVLGTGYAFDPYRPPSTYIKWVLSRAMHPGAIIILHDAGGERSRTIAALAPIIQAALASGLKFCTLSEILAPGLDPEKP
jgi:chitin deacetylase